MKNMNDNKFNRNYGRMAMITIELCLSGTCQDIQVECIYTYYEGYPSNETDPAVDSSVDLHYVWVRYDRLNRVDIMKLLGDSLKKAIEDDLAENEYENRGQ